MGGIHQRVDMIQYAKEWNEIFKRYNLDAVVPLEDSQNATSKSEEKLRPTDFDIA